MLPNIAALDSVWKRVEAVRDLDREGRPPIQNLVCEGGGVKTYAYIGAFEVLEKKGLLQKIERVAGSSGGAIASALLSIGYSPAELESIFKGELDLKSLLDSRTKSDPTRFLKLIGMKVGISNIWHLFKNKGFYKGGKFTEVFKDILQRKLKTKIDFLIREQNKDQINQLIEHYRELGYPNNRIQIQIDLFLKKQHEQFLDKYQIENFGKITFGQLQALKNDFPQLGFKELYVTGTRLSDATLRVFCAATDPNMPIVDAVRISMSFPLAFEPVYYQGDYYADGGISDNAPMSIFEKEQFLTHGVNQAGVNPCTLGLLVDSQKEIAARWGIKNTTKDFKLKNVIKGIISGMTSRVNELRKNYDINLVQIYDENVYTLDVNLPPKKMSDLIISGRKTMEEYCQNYMEEGVLYSPLPNYANIFEKYYSKKPTELIRILNQDIWPLAQEISQFLLILEDIDLEKELKIVKENQAKYSESDVKEQEKVFNDFSHQTMALAFHKERYQRLMEQIKILQRKKEKIWLGIDKAYINKNASEMQFLNDKLNEITVSINQLVADVESNDLKIGSIFKHLRYLEKKKHPEIYPLVEQQENIEFIINSNVIDKLQKTEQILHEHMDVILSALSLREKKYPDPRLADPIEKKLYLTKEDKLIKLKIYYKKTYQTDTATAMKMAQYHHDFVDELILFGLPIEKAFVITKKFIDSHKNNTSDDFFKNITNRDLKIQLWKLLLIEEMTQKKLIATNAQKEEVTLYWHKMFEQELKKDKNIPLPYAAYLAKKETLERWRHAATKIAENGHGFEDFSYLQTLKATITSLQTNNWGDDISLVNRSDLRHNKKHMKQQGTETYGKHESNYEVKKISYHPTKKEAYLSYKRKHNRTPIVAHVLCPSKTKEVLSGSPEIIIGFEEPISTSSDQQFSTISRESHLRRKYFDQIKSRLLQQLKWNIQKIQSNQQKDEAITVTIVGQGLAGQDAQYMFHDLIQEIATKNPNEFKNIKSIDLLLDNPVKVSSKMAVEMAESIQQLKKTNPEINIKGYNCIQQKRIATNVFRYNTANLAGQANILSKLSPRDGVISVDIRDKYDTDHQYLFSTNQKESLGKALNKSSVLYSNKVLQKIKQFIIATKNVFNLMVFKFFPNLTKLLRTIPATPIKSIYNLMVKRDRKKPKISFADQDWLAKLKTRQDETPEKFAGQNQNTISQSSLEEKINFLIAKADPALHLAQEKRPPIENLVVEGGGVKVVACSGALAQMEENGMLQDVKRIAGSSAGGFIAGLKAVGFTGNELTKLFGEELRLKELLDRPLLDEIQALFKINKLQFGIDNLFCLFKNKGLFTGKIFKALVKQLVANKLKQQIKEMLFEQLNHEEIELLMHVPSLLSPQERNKRIDSYLEQKLQDFNKKYGITDLGKITFSQLRKLNQDYPQFDLKDLYVTGTATSDGVMKEFSADTEPDMPIVNAIRITMSYPGAFVPQKYKDEYYIDGAVANRYPMQIFDQERFLTHGLNDAGVNPCTLGILVDSQKDINERWGITQHAYTKLHLNKIINSAVTGLRNRVEVLHNKYNINSIQISDNLTDNGYRSISDFTTELTDKEKKRFIQNGREAINFYYEHYMKGDVIYSEKDAYENLYQKYFTKTAIQLQKILVEEINPLIHSFEEVRSDIQKELKNLKAMRLKAENKDIPMLEEKIKKLEKFERARLFVLQQKTVLLRALELKGINLKEQKKKKLAKRSSYIFSDVPSLLSSQLSNTDQSNKLSIITQINNPAIKIPFNDLIKYYEFTYNPSDWTCDKKQNVALFRNKLRPAEVMKISKSRDGIHFESNNLEQMANVLLMYQDLVAEKNANLICSIDTESTYAVATLMEKLNTKGFNLAQVRNVKLKEITKNKQSDDTSGKPKFKPH